MSMDFYDFPATQVCDVFDKTDPEPSQTFGGNRNEKKQVGILIVNGTEHPIYTGLSSIGRLVSNNIVLKDTTVSKKHAEIEGLRKTCFIMDLKSCNGTFRNKEKLVPNKSYELSDKTSLRFGSVSAIFRKVSTIDTSILKTPATSRCNEIIASTPDSVLNTTDDDSVVYGTQKNEGSSEFRQPSLPPQRLEASRRNLNQEFFNDDSLLNSETGSTSIHEQETQVNLLPKKDDSSGIHDLETQEFSFNKSRTSNPSNEKSCENSEAIYETETQAVLLNSKSGDSLDKAETSYIDEEGNFQKSDKIHEANIQVLPVKSVKNSESDDEGISNVSTQKASRNCDKIHEEATQAFLFKDAVVQSKKLDKSESIIEDFDTDEEEIFKEPIQKGFAKPNIHEYPTQAFAIKSPSTNKSDGLKKLNKGYSKTKDSDTVEEGIFTELTQNVSTKSDKIHKEAIQVSAKSLTNKDSKSEDSDTDEEGIFKELTQKVSTKSDKIHEEPTQACMIKSQTTNTSTQLKILNKDSKIKDSDTDEGGIFKEPSEKVSSDSDKIHEEATQTCVKSPTISKSVKLKNMNESDLKVDNTEKKIFKGPTLKVSAKSDVHEEAAQASTNKTDSSNTDEEGIFKESTQKVSDKIYEDATQAFLLKTPINSEKASEIQDSDTDEEGIFTRPTQKYTASSPKKIHEEATHPFLIQNMSPILRSKVSAKADSNITNDSNTMQAKSNLKSKSTTFAKASSDYADDSETDDEGNFQGPIQKYSSKKIHETEPLSVNGEVSKFNSKCNLVSEKVDSSVSDSETDDEGIFNALSKEISSNSDKVQKAKTPVSKSVSKDSNSESKISTKVELKIPQDSDAHDQGILLKKEDSNTTEDIKQKKIQKSSIQKPKPLTSGQNDSETDDEGIFKKEEDSNTRKELKQKEIPKNLKMSLKPSASKQNDSETDDEGMFAWEASKISKKSSADANQLQESEIDDLAATQMISIPSPFPRESLGSKNASIEDIDYEMAPTQLLEDYEASKVKTPENKSNSGSAITSGNKTNSGGKNSGKRSSNRRSTKKLNDTVEENLNQMFEGTSREIEQPSQMMTQQLKNILEESQVVNEELKQTPPTSRTKAVRKVKISKNKSHFIAKINSGSTTSSGYKTNSGNKNPGKRSSNRRSTKNLNDTIEENLDQMFEGASREIEQPSQMMTQQIKSILEESQVVNGELMQTPSTSRKRAARKIETSPLKTSPSLSKRSLRLQKSPQVCKFHFKPQLNAFSDSQVVLKKDEKSYKLSDESDEDFVPFMPNQISLNLKDSLSLKGNSNLKFCPGSPAASTSSELSIDEGLLKSSPSLSKSKCGKVALRRNKIGKRKSKSLLSTSFGNFRIHEEVEKLARSTNLKVDSDDDSDFEDLKRMASRILETKNIYVKNMSAIESKIPKVSLEDSKISVEKLKVPIEKSKTSVDKLKVVESPSIFQVEADNCSPRMSKLNIIRLKKGSTEKKAESLVQKKSKEDKTEDKKTPLKKRVLRNNYEEPETSSGDQEISKKEELEMTNLYAKRSLSFQNSTKIDTEQEPSVEEPVKKNTAGKLKIVLRMKSSDSSEINDTSEEPKPKGRGRKYQKKANDEPKTDSLMNRRAKKRTASSSLVEVSPVPDSGEVPENLKVPSKAKKPRNQKANVIENQENANGHEVEALKTRRINKRKASQSKEVINNASSASSLTESSFNEATTSMSEKSKVTERKKTATRGRKKKEVSNLESAKVDNSSVSSSMLSVTEGSGDGNSSAASTPSRSKRSRTASPFKHKVLFTGVTVKDYQKSLTKLGLSDTEDIKKCTVLVTDKVRRTFKFLCAISQGIPIVSVNWLTDSAKKMNIQDLEQYIVKDPASEAKFGFSLSKSLQKARDKKMLTGYTVVLTPNITAPPVAELKGMVLASGGKAVLRPPAKWPENTVIVSDEKDSANAKKFMAKAPKAVLLHSTEFLLTGILKQEVDLKSYLLSIK